MTFSIIARCPRSGQFGIGIASYSIAIGRYCDGAVRANTGVTLTLGNPLPRNNYLAINLLAQGRTAGQALNELIANDADNAFRQIALVDRENSAVAHTGANLRKWAGHRVGNGYVVFGEPRRPIGAGRDGSGSKAPGGTRRQLLARSGGRNAGGIVGGKAGARRSAALVLWVIAPNEVDRLCGPGCGIEELRHIYVDYEAIVAHYGARAQSAERYPRDGVRCAVEAAGKGRMALSIIARCAHRLRRRLDHVLDGLRPRGGVRPNVSVSMSRRLPRPRRSARAEHACAGLCARRAHRAHARGDDLVRSAIRHHDREQRGRMPGRVAADGPAHGRSALTSATGCRAANRSGSYFGIPEAAGTARTARWRWGRRDAGGQMSRHTRPERSAWMGSSTGSISF
jgi:hypothetical protein